MIIFSWVLIPITLGILILIAVLTKHSLKLYQKQLLDESDELDDVYGRGDKVVEIVLTTDGNKNKNTNQSEDI